MSFAVKSLFALVAMLTVFSYCPQVEAGGSRNRVRLEARLTGATLASGKAKYEARSTTRRKFSVEVEDSLPATVHTIMVTRGGVGVAMYDMTTNMFGGIDLNLDTVRGQATPVLQDGDVVTIWVMGQILLSGEL